MRRLLYTLLTASALIAQNSGGPSLGFVRDASSRELRPILGIPGASRLGDPVSLPSSITELFLAPGNLYALAARGPADPIAIVQLSGVTAIQAAPALVPLPSEMTQRTLVAFSPTGRAAVLYSHQKHRLEVFSGLPSSPRVTESFAVNLANALERFAVSDDATAVLAADSTGIVYGLAANGAPQIIYHASTVEALLFASQTTEALVADAEATTVTVLQVSGSHAGVQKILPFSPTQCHAQGAALTTNGRTILLACPAEQSILSLDLTSGVSNSYAVAGSPAAFEATGVQDTFLLSPPDGNTYWLFGWRSNGPTISFIGAARDPQAGAGK